MNHGAHSARERAAYAGSEASEASARLRELEAEVERLQRAVADEEDVNLRIAEERDAAEAEGKRLRLSEARTRDDCRRASEAWKALKGRTMTVATSDPGIFFEGKPVMEEIDVADFPYPREWELEDQLLTDRAEGAEAERDTAQAQAKCWESIAEARLGRLAEAEIRVSERENALRNIQDVDKTPPYGYGPGKDNENALGQLAGVGKRWKTPWEIVEGLRLPKPTTGGAA